jgi:hypothetical protein
LMLASTSTTRTMPLPQSYDLIPDTFLPFSNTSNERRTS